MISTTCRLLLTLEQIVLIEIFRLLGQVKGDLMVATEILPLRTESRIVVTIDNRGRHLEAAYHFLGVILNPENLLRLDLKKGHRAKEEMIIEIV